MTFHGDTPGAKIYAKPLEYLGTFDDLRQFASDTWQTSTVTTFHCRTGEPMRQMFFDAANASVTMSFPAGPEFEPITLPLSTRVLYEPWFMDQGSILFEYISPRTPGGLAKLGVEYDTIGPTPNADVERQNPSSRRGVRPTYQVGAYYVYIPAERITYGPYTNLGRTKTFARIGSQHGQPREVYQWTGRSWKLIRRYVDGQRAWPRER